MINYTEPAPYDFKPRFEPLRFGACAYHYTEFGALNVAKVYVDLHKVLRANLEHLANSLADWGNERVYSDWIFLDAINSVEPFVENVSLDAETFTPIFHQLSNEWFLSTHKATTQETEFLRTMDYAQYLKTLHWKHVRYSMLAIHGANCMGDCGRGDMWLDLPSLHVHHVTYSRRGAEHQKDLRLLCADCHKQEHGLTPMPSTDDLGWLPTSQRRVYVRRKMMGQGEEYLKAMWEIHEGRMTMTEYVQSLGTIRNDSDD